MLQPIHDTTLEFSKYVTRCRQIIKDRREDLTPENCDKIIEANSPYEFHPSEGRTHYKYGALLIHGLLDCPFTLKDIGGYLQQCGVLVRSILLPGHGTRPSDLLRVSYHDWIKAVSYGVESFRDKVDELFLIGYSTGATLSIYQALQDEEITGIVLLSPAIRIKTPVHLVVGWHQFINLLHQKTREWVHQDEAIDYTKYHSITFNAVEQVSCLTNVIKNLYQTHTLSTPMLMILSREDETISSQRAMNFFARTTHPKNQMLLYTTLEHPYPDSRIETRNSQYTRLRIKHFSHVSLPFAPNNSHYGEAGDYRYASHLKTKGVIFGAYNHLEMDYYKMLHSLGLLKYERRELTYNPDFEFMANKIEQFMVHLN